MDVNREAANRWHDINFATGEWPDELPLADDYHFHGPPMSFERRDPFLSIMRTAGPSWLAGNGATKLLARYDDGEWFTSVFTFHSATSDSRTVGVLTSRLVDGLVTEDYFAYDPRIAYNQVTDLPRRLDAMLGEIPGATYGLP